VHPRRTLAISGAVAAALIPAVLWLGHERPFGCEHPTRFPCDPGLVRPGWVGPVVALLLVWFVVVGLGVALTAAHDWGRSHDAQARVVAGLLLWSAVADVMGMPAALWLGRDQRVGCEPPVNGPCDVFGQPAHPWAGKLFFALCLWFVVAVVFAAVARPDHRLTDDA
jgi:hypothetical protein